MTLIGVIVAILVIGLVFWLLQKFVAPAVPDPWGRILMAVFALFVVILLLTHFFPELLTMKLG